MKSGAIVYGLRIRTAELVGHWPTEAELVEVADRFQPTFDRLTQPTAPPLSEVLKAALWPDQTHLEGGPFIVLGALALGSLLEPDVVGWLNPLRPRLAERTSASDQA